MKITPTSLVLLAFGLVALIGLIVLAGTHTLDDATRTALVSIVTAALTGAGVATVPHDTLAGTRTGGGLSSGAE